MFTLAPNSTFLTLHIEQYTPDEEVQALAQLLATEGQEAVEKAMWKLDRGWVRIGSRLGYPLAVTRSFETEDGRLFLAMACYEGETLNERIARGPLRIEEALRIARETSDGLAYLMAVSVALMISTYALLNLAMVTSLILTSPCSLSSLVVRGRCDNKPKDGE